MIFLSSGPQKRYNVQKIDKHKRYTIVEGCLIYNVKKGIDLEKDTIVSCDHWPLIRSITKKDDKHKTVYYIRDNEFSEQGQVFFKKSAAEDCLNDPNFRFISRK
jgi:hypothetical protein